MKRLFLLLSAILIWGVLIVPIPIDRANTMTEDEAISAKSSIQTFFNLVDKCEKSEFTNVFEQNNMLYLVIECMDAKKGVL